MPLISVIIPVYNSEKTIERCIDSVLTQSFSDWEIIAIDDGSTDKSNKILTKYMNQDCRIKLISQKNMGPGIARNTGIDSSNGEYIVFIDSDDFIETDYFLDLKKIISNSNVDVIFINLIQETATGLILKNEYMSAYKKYDSDTLIRYQMTGKMPWGAVRKVVRSSLIKNNNIRFTEDVAGEEAIYSFRVLYEAKEISFTSKLNYHYVNYPNSQSKKSLDPWGPPSIKMKRYMEDCGLIGKYNETLNAFGAASLVSRIINYSRYNSLYKTMKIARKYIEEFKKTFGFEIDYGSLKLHTKLCVSLIRINLILPVIIVGAAKQIYKKIRGFQFRR